MKPLICGMCSEPIVGGSHCNLIQGLHWKVQYPNPLTIIMHVCFQCKWNSIVSHDANGKSAFENYMDKACKAKGFKTWGCIAAATKTTILPITNNSRKRKHS